MVKLSFPVKNPGHSATASAAVASLTGHGNPRAGTFGIGFCGDRVGAIHSWLAVTGTMGKPWENHGKTIGSGWW